MADSKHKLQPTAPPPTMLRPPARRCPRRAISAAWIGRGCCRTEVPHPASLSLIDVFHVDSPHAGLIVEQPLAGDAGCGDRREQRDFPAQARPLVTDFVCSSQGMRRIDEA